MDSNPNFSIVFFVSGGGSNLRFINRAIQHFDLPWEVIAVVADRSCPALVYAANNHLHHYQLRYSQKRPEMLRSLMPELQADLGVATFDKIIDQQSLALADFELINLHYSLLPRYAGTRGMKGLELAAEAKDVLIGATTHWISAKVDEGPILGSWQYAVDWEIESLAELQEITFRNGALLLLNTVDLIWRTMESTVDLNKPLVARYDLSDVEQLFSK